MNSYKLELQPYCENCEGFEVKSIEEYDMNIMADGYNVDKLLSRIITCKHANKCKQMYRHLKRVEKEKAE